MGLYREKFAILRREAERNATWLIASLWHLVPSRDESPPCLVEVVHMNDWTKHDGMATLFFQFQLLVISAFATVE